MSTLRCSRCGEDKSPEDFKRDKRNTGRDGRSGWCRPCANTYAAERRASNPGYQIGHSRKSHLKRRYGITPDDVDQKLAAQGGRCAICRSSEPGGPNQQWCVDHDHETGALRDILCCACNRGLGCFLDNPVVLLAAADYVLRHFHQDVMV